MHANTERVAAALRAGGASSEITELAESARTAIEAAAAVGAPVGAIVKSLIFLADGVPVLVLGSGDHQVDTALVAAALGVSVVKRADAGLVREVTGFAIGGVAPIALATPLRTVIDTHLATFEVLWAAAGTPHTVFATSYDELARLSAATPAVIAAAS